VLVSHIEIEKDDLYVGECELMPALDCDKVISEFHPIDTRLKEIFERYPEVSALYQKTCFDDPTWVINRWIELLPVGGEQKQMFLKQENYNSAFDYLSELIE